LPAPETFYCPIQKDGSHERSDNNDKSDGFVSISCRERREKQVTGCYKILNEIKGLQTNGTARSATGELLLLAAELLLLRSDTCPHTQN
jgi:hypothetical protein